MLLQDFDAFQCAENSHVSIVVPAMRNRINMRPEQDNRQLRIASFSAANDVSRSIDTDFESGLLHQAFYVLATFTVCVAEGNPAYASFGICSEFGKIFDPLFHSRRIGPEILPVRAPTEQRE